MSSKRTFAFSLPALAGVVLLGVAVSGCGEGGPAGADGVPVRVVCTTTIVADVVRNVGGDRVAVETLMGPGVDPHRYLPTAGDRGKLDAARLVFFSGLHLEGKMADVLEKADGRAGGVAVTRDVPPAALRPAEPGSDAAHDPHVWFDVKLWSHAVGTVRDELAAADPAGADAYRKNADAYLKELDALDAWVRAEVQKVPDGRRVLVTSHDAFGYFGRAYGVEVRGLQGVSTASEAGIRDRQELAKFLGARKIPAVFAETSVVDDGLKAVLETCRADYKHEVRIVGGTDALYSDALGPPGSPGDTYAGMVRHNVTVIVGALAK